MGHGAVVQCAGLAIQGSLIWSSTLSDETINEPAHEIMALFVLHKLILQKRMRSHPVGLDVWFLVGPFIYFHPSWGWTAMALAWAFAGRLCDKYHNLMSWLKSRSCLHDLVVSGTLHSKHHHAIVSMNISRAYTTWGAYPITFNLIVLTNY